MDNFHGREARTVVTETDRTKEPNKGSTDRDLFHIFDIYKELNKGSTDRDLFHIFDIYKEPNKGSTDRDLLHLGK